MITAEFDFFLPPELIAQHPALERDASRLFHLRRATRSFHHHSFSDLPSLLRPGDLLIFNDSKTIPARMRGRKTATGGAIEFLLLEEIGENDWWVLLRPAKRLRPGDSFIVNDSTIRANLVEKNAEGHCRLRFQDGPEILAAAQTLGEMPLPPYIERRPGQSTQEDAVRYQTIYARHAGSVATPTAGLHFTDRIFKALEQQGIQTAFVTLHVGAGTFAPVKAERLEEHTMHEERYDVPAGTVRAMAETKSRGGRVVAVGTTSLRVLESCGLRAGPGRTRIFIHPPQTFAVADAMVTNFHLPKSTLLMLAAAFAAPGETIGRALILDAYAEAIRQRYRFFSYGDAMLID